MPASLMDTGEPTYIWNGMECDFIYGPLEKMDNFVKLAICHNPYNRMSQSLFFRDPESRDLSWSKNSVVQRKLTVRFTSASLRWLVKTTFLVWKPQFKTFSGFSFNTFPNVLLCPADDAPHEAEQLQRCNRGTLSLCAVVYSRKQVLSICFMFTA